MGLVALYLFNPHSRSKQEELADYMTYSSDYAAQEVASNQQLRVPQSVSEDEPNFLKPPKIPLTLADLEKKFGGPLKVEKSPAGTSLTGQIPFQKEPGDSETQSLGKLVSDISSVMEIDHLEQLRTTTQSTNAGEVVTHLQQVFDGVPVDGSRVDIHQDASGHITLVHSTFLSGLRFVDINVKVPAQEAIKTVVSDATNLDPQNRQPEISPALLVIHKFDENRVELSWKIVTHQPWLLSHSTETYFVSARHPDAFVRVDTPTP